MHAILQAKIYNNVLQLIFQRTRKGQPKMKSTVIIAGFVIMAMVSATYTEAKVYTCNYYCKKVFASM